MHRMIYGYVVLACLLVSNVASAHAGHERYYEFDGTHFALSIERFMGLDYYKYEGANEGHVAGRLLLNASEPVPTSLARFGFDVFLHRFSLGIAGGVTTSDVAVLAPRVGYIFGLTPQLGLWLRAGGFYAKWGAAEYVGLTAEAILGWFPYPNIAITFGPTFDAAFANSGHPDYIAIGIPQFGLTAFL